MTKLSPSLTVETSARSQRRAGVFYSLSAYTCWGLFPLYLRTVRSLSAVEFLLHRMFWSVLLVLGVLAVQRQWRGIGQAFRSWRILRFFVASAVVLSVNWFVFVWAAQAGRVVDASLGYFINPLVTVAMGAFFLKERLRGLGLLAVGLASAGVLWLVIQVGEIPWIGLTLAASFATYGLLRKTAALGALEGLAVETLLLSPVAVGALAWMVVHGTSRFVTAPRSIQAAAVFAGPATTVPLLLFAAGARRIPLSLVGLLQYVGPTLQLFVGLFVFHEPFTTGKAVGYALIWGGFALASIDGLWRSVPAAVEEGGGTAMR